MASKKHSDWMGKLPEALHKVPLNHLAIPGSHDSFAYDFDLDAPMAPNYKIYLRMIVEFVEGLGLPIKEYIERWALTQEKSFKDQLFLGIRHFDLRSAWRDGQGYFVHGLFAGSIEAAMREMNWFLEDHPKEVITLDFNHFYDFTTARHMELLDILKEIFGDKLCPYPGKNITTVTLDYMWKHGHQVILFYNAHIDGVLKYWEPSAIINGNWPEASRVDKALDYLEHHYEKKRNRWQFYVTQGILTPDSWLIFRHLASNLKKECAEVMEDPFIKWLEEKKAGKDGINICIMDYVSEDYVAAVIKLNEDLA